MKHYICALALVLSVCASAQWTVVNFDTGDTGLYGVHSGQQVGQINSSQAVVWTGTPGSMVNLTPPGTQAKALAVADGVQVGEAYGHAGLWTGTAESWEDLHPLLGGFDRSLAGGVGDGEQVGWTRLNGVYHAALWRGTAASWINLNPQNAPGSSANAASGGTQVGSVNLGGINRASLWTGTAASWVDLTPAGFPTGSSANGVHGIHQVGAVDLGGIGRASLWTGTAASWVDLNPVGCEYSQAYGVSFDRQVGRADAGGESRASIWTSTASSCVDLHVYLPPQVSNSVARAIWTDAATGTTYVVGGTWMWVSRTVTPATYSMVRGSVFSGNLASLQSSDNNRLVMRPGFVFSAGEPPVQVRVNATATSASPNGFSFSVESAASFGNAQQKVWLWNYTIGDYELLDTRLATTTDNTVIVNVRTNTSRFIQPGTLSIRALVSYRAVGPAFAYPWSGRIDKVWWSFPG